MHLFATITLVLILVFDGVAIEILKQVTFQDSVTRCMDSNRTSSLYLQSDLDMSEIFGRKLVQTLFVYEILRVVCQWPSQSVNTGIWELI